MRHGGLNGKPPWEVMMAPFAYHLFPSLSMRKLGWPSFLLTVRPLEPSAVLKFSFLNVKTSALWLFWAHFCFLAFEYIPLVGWSSILCSFFFFLISVACKFFVKQWTCVKDDWFHCLLVNYRVFSCFSKNKKQHGEEKL